MSVTMYEQAELLLLPVGELCEQIAETLRTVARALPAVEDDVQRTIRHLGSEPRSLAGTATEVGLLAGRLEQVNGQLDALARLSAATITALLAIGYEMDAEDFSWLDDYGDEFGALHTALRPLTQLPRS